MNIATDLALGALSDPTRRRIFESLRTGPQSVGRIASSLPVSRPAVSQHLKILLEAGLVMTTKVGTRNLYRVDPSGLDGVRRYLDEFWGDVLSAFASNVDPTEHSSGSPRRSKK